MNWTGSNSQGSWECEFGVLHRQHPDRCNASFDFFRCMFFHPWLSSWLAGCLVGWFSINVVLCFTNCCELLHVSVYVIYQHRNTFSNFQLQSSSQLQVMHCGSMRNRVAALPQPLFQTTFAWCLLKLLYQHWQVHQLQIALMFLPVVRKMKGGTPGPAQDTHMDRNMIQHSKQWTIKGWIGHWGWELGV